MKKKLLLFIFFLGLAILTACNRAAAESPSSISDIIPQMNDAGCVLAFRCFTVDYHGDVFVSGSAEQNARGLKLLNDFKLDGLERTDENPGGKSWTGGSYIYLQWPEGGCRIDLSFIDLQTSRLHFVFDSGEDYYLVGDIEPIPALDELYTEIMQTEADGALQKPDSNSKGRKLKLREIIPVLDILENSAENGYVDPPACGDFSCTLSVENTDYLVASFYNIPKETHGISVPPPLSVTETTYSIDLSSGVFTRDTSNEQTYHQLSDSSLARVKDIIEDQ
ncbi:MAG: hypothetical protein VB078_02240 [Clostridiaceae bacterium]|nr:hypothetical protein [Clostridiaceae bacterium]